MYTFSSKDTYKISHYKKNVKFSVDFKVLVRLYEPIIGSIAMSLYLTLDSELSLNKRPKSDLKISRLHKLLQVNEEQFNEAIETLKEYKLLSIKASQKKADDFLFILYPTKSAGDFLADNKLNNALLVVVEESYYQQVYDYFMASVINEDEYIDIDEVKIVKELTEDEFYQQLFKNYPIITESTINSNVKKEINRLKKLFKITYSDIEKGIFQSVGYDEDGQLYVDLNKLNSYVEKEFKKVVINQNSDEEYAKMFDSIRSIAYYKTLSGRTSLLPSETSMINELLDEYKISEGILNVVINYYFMYGKNTFGISKNYFKKVIEEMIINNVKTTIDAMNYFRDRNKRIKKYKEKNEKVPVVKKDEDDSSSNNEIDQETLDEFRRLMGG